MLVIVSSIACGGSSSNPAGPSDSNPPADTPGITNNTDDFSFNLPNVTNYSTNGGYTWRNTGTSARVTQQSSISGGSGTLTVRDAGGRIVYSRNLSEGGTANTETGPAGDWRIEMAPSSVTGTIKYQVQKN